MNAQFSLTQGTRFPFDAPDDWWESNKMPPSASDWAHKAARGIIADLQDRRGIKQGFADLDEDVRKDIVESLAEIIREAAKRRSA